MPISICLVPAHCGLSRKLKLRATVGDHLGLEIRLSPGKTFFFKCLIMGNKQSQ